MSEGGFVGGMVGFEIFGRKRGALEIEKVAMRVF